MTDTAEAGSVTAEGANPQPSAGNPENANATHLTNGSGDAGKDLWNGLQDEGNRSLVEAKGWKDKSLDDVLSAYRGLESQQGKALVPPGENATADEWNAFYGKLGRPEQPTGYQFKVPETVPADMPYDAESAEKFKAWAHKAGLTPSQAQAIHDDFMADTAGRVSSMQADYGKSIDDAHRSIVKEWGDPETDQYKRNVELADRAARKLGLHDSLKKRGVIGQDGAVMDADFMFALQKIGSELYAEDKLHGGPQNTRNPWSGKHFNLTEQGKLVRSDPALAKAFIQSSDMADVDKRMALSAIQSVRVKG